MIEKLDDSTRLYFPQWNEFDKPTVKCPHFAGRRVGDDWCQKECHNLIQVIDEKYRTIIHCSTKYNCPFLAPNDIIKAQRIEKIYLERENNGKP